MTVQTPDTSTPDPIAYQFMAKPGLSAEVVEHISHYKTEPGWMRANRLRALEVFSKKALPTWGGVLSGIDFQAIHYFMSPTGKLARSWADVPADIRNTYTKIGIPEAEQKYLGGVMASTNPKRSTTRCGRISRSRA